MSVRNCQPGSVSTADPMPTNPPPAWKYASKAASWAAFSGLPVVSRKTTARKRARSAAVNMPGSPFDWTPKPFALPRSLMVLTTFW